MLLCLSFDHRTAPFSLLELLSRHESDIAESNSDAGLARGAVLLSTCNRFEAYLDVPGNDATSVASASSVIEGAAEAAMARIAEAVHIAPETLAEHSRVFSGQLAAEHLIGVASGLHSAAKGEEEIAGQVRRAHSAAQRAGTLTHPLEQLFQAATRTSRAVKHRTGLQSAGRSLVDLSLRMAESRVTDWSTARVLLIGTGTYAGATVAALRARGALGIEVFSPSGRAASFCERRDLTSVATEGLASALSRAQLVIACSRVEHPVLTLDELRTAPAEHERLLIDLGMPRNIDPGITAAPGVTLLDLQTITAHASVSELGAEAEALQIVREAAAEFAAAQAERDALPSLLSFRTHVLSILEDELCRVRRLHPEGRGAEAQLGEESLRRLTGRLLHEPMTRIRSLARAGKTGEATEALNALFGLDVDSAEPRDADAPEPRRGSPTQGR